MIRLQGRPDIIWLKKFDRLAFLPAATTTTDKRDITGFYTNRESFLPKVPDALE